uniref:PemK-like, MazF-like toxin of type II toxin-antitoxin system n=1 Tax=Candidatus Kentrum sp. FW TaxID=2126338 RepID=A0A450U1E9_9GAMM|nr:MAG: PemK-like, MazF-like toxin of type II toxin-antitoxin system [Candidatus Kentron sp. FW]
MVYRYIPEADDIVWLHLDPQAGHEQSGHRPALVISPSAYNHKTNLMPCCPMTTRIKGYPLEVSIAGDDSGVVEAATRRKRRHAPTRHRLGPMKHAGGRMGKGAVLCVRGYRGTIRRRAHRIFLARVFSACKRETYDGHGAGSDSAVFQAHHEAPLPILPPLPIRFGQSGIAEYNSAIPGKTERFDQTNRHH